MGVCKEWRECSWCVDSLVFDCNGIANRSCNMHEEGLRDCGCVSQSLCSIIARSYGLKRLVLHIAWPEIGRMLGGCDWTHLRYSLEMLSLSASDPVPRDSQLFHKLSHKISSCTRLSAIQLGFVDCGLPLLEDQKVLKMTRFSLMLQEQLVVQCRSLEHLEVCTCSGHESAMINAPNLLVLRWSCPVQKTLKLVAPRLRHVYLNKVCSFVTEGSALRELTLATPTALTFTGTINFERVHVNFFGYFVPPPLPSVYQCLKGLEEPSEAEDGKLGTSQSITIQSLYKYGDHRMLECLVGLISLCPNAQTIVLKGSSEHFKESLKRSLPDEKLIILSEC